MWGVVHQHGCTSIAVFIIHLLGILGLKEKCIPPITTYSDRPRSATVPSQLMQTETGQIHIFWGRSCMKATENKPKPLRMASLNPSSAASFKEIG